MSDVLVNFLAVILNVAGCKFASVGLRLSTQDSYACYTSRLLDGVGEVG